MPKPCDKEVKRVEVQTDHQVATYYSALEFLYQFHLNYKYMISISILYTIILQGNDESNNVPTVEKLKLLKSSAPGSMEKYLELREQEKQAAILQSQSQPENQESQPESGKAN